MEAEAEMVACGQSPWWERPGHWEEGPAKAWGSCARGQEVPGSAGPSSWGPSIPLAGSGASSGPLSQVPEDCICPVSSPVRLGALGDCSGVQFCVPMRLSSVSFTEGLG